MVNKALSYLSNNDASLFNKKLIRSPMRNQNEKQNPTITNSQANVQKGFRLKIF